MVYAYYVVMGGFVADIDHLHNSLKRVTITPTGVLFMASEAYFPRIKRSDIQDKSKALPVNNARSPHDSTCCLRAIDVWIVDPKAVERPGRDGDRLQRSP
jgi:predicted NAD-dependent protein-ADP-ribosyltransferase YbiA (DUF1768 family)